MLLLPHPFALIVTFAIVIQLVKAAGFASLEAALGGTSNVLVYPNSSFYNEEIGEFWNVDTQAIRPQIIIRPKNAAELAIAVKTMGDANVSFAVRAGGHTPNPDWNNSPSVLVALSNFDEVEMVEPGVARIGAGLRWSTVYEKLQKWNVTAVGGRYAFVGVGGYLTGGGLSHLSNEYGYGADTLTQVEVVLSSGEVVNASSTSHPDLFWAVKGGSNNFGIVTRFYIRTVPQPGGVWGGMMSISSEYVNQTLQAMAKWQQSEQEKDVKAAVLLSLTRGPFVDSLNTTTASLSLYYGAPVAYPEVLRLFWEIPAVSSTLRFTTHLNMTLELATGDNDKKRHIFYTGTYAASAEMNQQGHDMFMSAIDDTTIFSDQTSYTALTLQPISGSMLSQGVSTHPMGLDPSGAPYIWISIHVEWTDESKTEEVKQFTKNILQRLLDLATSITGKSVEYVYLNDGGPTQNPLQSYGEANLGRMRNIAERYDPRRVFTDLVGGYKLT